MMKRTSLVSVILLAVVAGVAVPQPPGGEDPGTPVTTTRAELGAFVQPIRLTGTVEPANQSYLSAEQDGVLAEILVEEGDKVTQGTPLARLRMLPLELEVARTEARLEAAKASLVEMETGSRAEDIAAAAGELAEARASLANAEREYRRYEELLKEKTASEQEYDAALQRFRSMEAMAKVAEARYDLEVNGPRNEWVLRAQAEVAAAEAEAGVARDHLERATIRAPYDGTVTGRQAAPGMWLGKGDPVFSFQSDGKVYVRVHVPEGFFSRISQGDTIDVYFDAAPGQPFRGTVEQIIPRADGASRAFPVRLAIANEDGLLAPGMLARVTVEPKATGQSVVIPKDAIVAQGPRPVVYRVDRSGADPVAERLEIDTGRYFGKAVEVYGLNAGDEVIIRGNETLRPGAKLLLNEFLTNPDTARIN